MLTALVLTPVVGEMLVTVGAGVGTGVGVGGTGILLVTVWLVNVASTPPSPAVTVPSVYLTVTALPFAIALPDVVRLIWAAFALLSDAVLNAWSAPPFI